MEHAEVDRRERGDRNHMLARPRRGGPQFPARNRTAIKRGEGGADQGTAAPGRRYRGHARPLHIMSVVRIAHKRTAKFAQRTREASLTLRNASELLRARVDQTIEALGLDDKDAAAVKLAREYADLIDSALDDDHASRAWALRWIGPLLLDTLTELGATPGARARVRKTGTSPHAAPGKLAALRSAREA